MNQNPFFNRGAASRHGSQWNASALVIGFGASSSSAQPRHDFDFGRLPGPDARPGTPSRLRQAYSRFRDIARPAEHVHANNEQPLLGGAQARVRLHSRIRTVARREQGPGQSDVGLGARVRFASRLGDIAQPADHRPPAQEQHPRSGWFPQLAWIRRRARVTPSAADQAFPPAGNMSALEGGKPITPGESNLRLMRAELESAVPVLKEGKDEEFRARVKGLARQILALETLLIDAGEFGFSRDRVVNALREHTADADAEAALAIAQRMIRKLTECLTTDAVKGKPSRRGLILAGLHLTMPHLSDEIQPCAPAREIDPCNVPETLVQGLIRLDKSFTGRPGYAFDRLFSVLCNHARIVEFSRQRATADRALTGLLAMVDSVNESIASDRDGYALNTLIGIDPRLDDAIVDLRTRMVESFMDAHSVWVDAASAPKCAAELAKDAEDLASDAKQLVTMECELARAKARLAQAFVRAFDHSGIERPVEVLRGMRMDSAMVNGLVKQLEQNGHHAKDVGLAIMAVFLLEQEIARSKGGVRMRQCVLWDTAASKERITKLEKKLVLLRRLASTLAPQDDLPARLAQIDALEANLKRDRACVRTMEPREKSLADPGMIGPENVEKLGLTGMQEKHVRQLERQGLSSAAEAHRALAMIQKSLDNWLADKGLARMKKFGLFAVLRTKRQEQRAELLGKALLEMHQHRLQDGKLVTDAADDPAAIRKALVRAAILHQVTIEQKARGPKGMPVLAGFRPRVSAVRGQLVKWGLDEDLTSVIEAEIGDEDRDEGINLKKIASWAQDVELPTEQPAPALDEALPAQQQAAHLRSRLVKLLPRKSNNVNQIEFLVGDEIANQLIVRDAVRMVMLDRLLAGDLFGPQPDEEEKKAILAALEQHGVQGAQSIVDEETATPMTPKKLAAWQEAAQERELRKELGDSLVDVRIATRVRMHRFQRLKLASGSFGDTVGVSGRVSAGRMTGVDFGNPGDPGGSMENVFRAGLETKLGLDLRVPLVSMTQNVGIKLGPIGSVDFAGHGLKGVVVRCKDAASQQALTRKLLQKSNVTFDDLVDADDLMFLREEQGAVEVGAGVYAAFQSGAGEFDMGSAHHARPGLGARVLRSVSIQWSRSIAQNNKARIERLETIQKAPRTALLQAGGSMRADEDAQSNVSAQMLEFGVRRENEVRDRIRTLERGGRVVDAETFNQSFLAGKSALELVNKLAGPSFERFMQLLQENEATAAVHHEIIALIADIRRNELGSVARQLDPTAGFYAGNALLDQSNAARAHRVNSGGIRENHASAKDIRGQAQRIFKDRSLYNVARVAAVPVKLETQSIALLMGLFEETQVLTGESLPVEIKLYAPGLLAMATQARRELRYGVSGSAPE